MQHVVEMNDPYRQALFPLTLWSLTNWLFSADQPTLGCSQRRCREAATIGAADTSEATDGREAGIAGEAGVGAFLGDSFCKTVNVRGINTRLTEQKRELF